MTDFYRDQILSHYRNPQNYGTLAAPTVSLGDKNVSCGDTITMQAVIENGKVVDIAFGGESCAISTASASLLTEQVKGKTTEEIKKMKTDDVLNLLGITLTPTRLKCALLPLEVLQKMLSNV